MIIIAKKIKRVIFTFGFTSAILLMLMTIYHSDVNFGDLRILDLLHKTTIAYVIGSLFSVAIFIAGKLFYPSLKSYTDFNLTALFLLGTILMLYAFSGDIALADVNINTIYTIASILVVSMLGLAYIFELIEKIR